MERFVRGVGSKRGQGDQDGVEVPRRMDEVERKNIGWQSRIPGEQKQTRVYLLTEEGGEKENTDQREAFVLQLSNKKFSTLQQYRSHSWSKHDLHPPGATWRHYPIVDPSMTSIDPEEHGVTPYSCIPNNIRVILKQRV